MPIIVDPTNSVTFLSLQTEFYARGFDYLNNDVAGQTRAKRWLNQSALELCEEELWPFLAASLTGAPPLLIPDLRSIRSVADTTQSEGKLEPFDADEIGDWFGSLTTAGTAQFFYLDNLTVNVYPVGGFLRVRYFAVPAEMVGDSDLCPVPRRFVNTVINGAVRRAQMDSDNKPGADSAEAERQLELDRMRRSYGMLDGTRHYQRITGASDDW